MRTVAAALLLVAAAASAHTRTPQEICAELEAAPMRAAYDVVTAAPDPRLARLLVVRVGARWRALPADVRRRAAEDWYALWRHDVPQGIVAVLDAANDAPVVNYDPAGRARLIER